MTVHLLDAIYISLEFISYKYLGVFLWSKWCKFIISNRQVLKYLVEKAVFEICDLRFHTGRSWILQTNIYSYSTRFQIVSYYTSQLHIQKATMLEILQTEHSIIWLFPYAKWFHANRLIYWPCMNAHHKHHFCYHCSSDQQIDNKTCREILI